MRDYKMTNTAISSAAKILNVPEGVLKTKPIKDFMAEGIQALASIGEKVHLNMVNGSFIDNGLHSHLFRFNRSSGKTHFRFSDNEPVDGRVNQFNFKGFIGDDNLLYYYKTHKTPSGTQFDLTNQNDSVTISIEEPLSDLRYLSRNIQANYKDGLIERPIYTLSVYEKNGSSGQMPLTQAVERFSGLKTALEVFEKYWKK